VRKDGFYTLINKKIKGASYLLMCLCLMGTFTSCIQKSSSGKRTTSSAGISNDSSSVSVGYGRILSDNPIILSGNSNLSSDTNLNTLLSSSQDFITNNSYLEESCTNITNCYEVKGAGGTSLFQSTDGKWAFDTSTDEWVQVNAFGHMKSMISNFHTDLTSLLSQSQFYSYDSSIPSTLFTSNAHWDYRTLTTYATYDLPDNAAFSPSEFELQIGYNSSIPSLKYAEDPTVIYHEMGHAFNQILMNMRNVAAYGSAASTPQSNLGILGYDEAGAIGEGVADYFSYYMNGRTHFGEWAFGAFQNASRPMSEADSIHVSGIDQTASGRLSYPQFLNYNPHSPTSDVADIHYAGQIISHFMVAVTEDLMSSCSFSQSTATKQVFNILAETFAELGDYSATGSDNKTGATVNLDSTSSDIWLKKAKPITFRSFAQTFAKYTYTTLGNSNLNICNGSIYLRDDLEQLLDQYGLLLFKNYNEDGSGITTGHSGTHTEVSVLNRQKTDLINKELLVMDPTANATLAYVIDNQEDMVSVLQNFTASGRMEESLTSLIPASLPYNNANLSISPGEFVGVLLNIFNNSNSTMAGVQLLGNDWDHFKNDEPCNNLGDNFPLDSEGAADLTAGEGTDGGCDYVTRDNGVGAYGSDTIEPVCFVQILEDNATKWTTQEEYRQEIGLSESKCLAGSSSTDDCFIRIPKGLDHAFYSKIDAQQTWAQTYADDDGDINISTHNLLYMEVSPWITPGTTFNCRFRATFSNCEDCYNDTSGSYDDDDYLDYEFSGAKPYQIINFQFTVID
jgi:hypothetical protein